MKKVAIFVCLMALLAGAADLPAQSSQKSSGVVELNMKKKRSDVPADPVTRQQNVSSTTFTPVRVPKAEPATGGTTGAITTGRVLWSAPAFSTVKTSNNAYKLKATVTSPEQLRVINIFLNDRFYKNVMVGSGAGNRVNVEETVELELGSNEVRLEGVGVSGGKVEDRVYINYDLSSARYYALIIAVEEYDDPAINDLSEPVNDADKFFRIINSRYTFNVDDITYLKNPTKADIIGTLHKMRGRVTEEDNLLIYYAGHGYWDEEMMTGYWLPRDAQRDNPVNWLPNTDLTNYLNVLRTKHTLLIADACFSGGIFKTRSAFANTGTIEKLYRLPSRKAITSGTLTEVPDQSVFIEYLLKRLNENQEPYLSSEQLFSSMRTAVINNSDNVPQYGTIQNVGDEGGDFVFIRRR
jgi:hypothetical protein